MKITSTLLALAVTIFGSFAIAGQIDHSVDNGGAVYYSDHFVDVCMTNRGVCRLNDGQRGLRGLPCTCGKDNGVLSMPARWFNVCQTANGFFIVPTAPVNSGCTASDGSTGRILELN